MKTIVLEELDFFEKLNECDEWPQDNTTKLDGVYYEWMEDGTIKTEAHYKDGKLVKMESLDRMETNVFVDCEDDCKYIRKVK